MYQTAAAAIPSDASQPPRDQQRRRMILRLAQNVARARAKAGLTQHQLAAAADLSRATIHLYRGRRVRPASLDGDEPRGRIGPQCDQFVQRRRIGMTP